MTLPELLAPEMLPEAFDNFEQVVMTALFRPLFVSVKRRLEEAAKTTEGDGMPKLP
jgi:hypothetical protein